MKKVNIQLGAVQETLLLPLVARAAETQFKNPILNDTKAYEITQLLDINTKQLLQKIQQIGIIGLCERAYRMDIEVRKFMKKHPKGKVLNIGAGLDTSFYRVDNGKVKWYDLDLPDSMELRKKILPIPNSRVTYIEKSMLDYSWIEDIGDISDGLFITIPGVLMYFKEAQVQQFFQQIAPKLKGAEVLFDVISKIGKFFVGIQVKRAGMKNASMDWGIKFQHQMTGWTPHLQPVQRIKFYHDTKFQKEHKITTKYMMEMNQWFNIAQLFHFKFV